MDKRDEAGMSALRTRTGMLRDQAIRRHRCNGAGHQPGVVTQASRAGQSLASPYSFIVLFSPVLLYPSNSIEQPFAPDPLHAAFT